jgi:hypothetical protein
MKARLKRTALATATVFVLIQFIQPARNESGQVLDTDISKTISLPEDVRAVLNKSCYDCHSNSTNYPWYAYIQPVGWYMAYHIRNGKEKLNFSEFGAYSKRRQGSKLESIGKQIEAGAMPLPSYLLLHGNAALLPSEKELIVNWANDSRDSLTTNH